MRNRRAVQGKTASVRLYRREMAEAAFPARNRAVFLEKVREGVQPRLAAEAVNVSLPQVYGRARWDREFQKKLDEALEIWSADRMSDQCGTPTGYRLRKCLCRRCRSAHRLETYRYR
jgi:hypothetical protein